LERRNGRVWVVLSYHEYVSHLESVEWGWKSCCRME
jgi:hypothetical protein